MRDAIVVGAGIGGLAAAVALRRVGWDVRIYERASAARELGFGLLLAPNALGALRELQVADALAGAPVAGGGVEIRRLNGTTIRRFSRPVGGSSVVALRAELHGALLNAIGDTPVAFGGEAVGLTDGESAAQLKLANGSTQTAAVLVGADGVNSVVRGVLHPDEPPPRSSGYTAVRGVAYGAPRFPGGLQAVAYLDKGVEAATVRAGADGNAVYWYLSLLTGDLPSHPAAASVIEELLRRCEPRLRDIFGATRKEDMRLDTLLVREPLAAWGRGRTTLLGDAAHPLLPHTGQGAAQALEDAVALGRALADDMPVPEALRRYEAARARRTRRFVKLGPRIARVTTTHSSAIDIIRTTIIKAVPEVLVSGRSAAASLPRPRRPPSG
jgi:2-polyprenyl-6-methoxyphenol hydroxylase-like FAD-dependent oxidoreductase